MIEINIQKLANLSRIFIDEGEMKQLEQEIPEILEFVDQIQEAVGESSKDVGDHYNIFRYDKNPHESGKYTKEMIEAMPNSQDGYLEVRKIISQD